MHCATLYIRPFFRACCNSPKGKTARALSTTLMVPRSHTSTFTDNTDIPTSHPSNVAVVWFRVGDLRIHDHEALYQAHSSGNALPVHLFIDTDLFRREGDDRSQFPHLSSTELPRVGPHRLAAILASLHELKSSLEQRGSSLLYIKTTPNDNDKCTNERAATSDSLRSALYSLFHNLSSSSSSSSSLSLYYYPQSISQPNHPTEKERQVLDAFQHTAAQLHLSFTACPCTAPSSFLYHPQDIGYDTLKDLIVEKKSNMTEFRSFVQSNFAPRKPVESLSLLSTNSLHLADGHHHTTSTITNNCYYFNDEVKKEFDIPSTVASCIGGQSTTTSESAKSTRWAAYEILRGTTTTSSIGEDIEIDDDEKEEEDYFHLYKHVDTIPRVVPVTEGEAWQRIRVLLSASSASPIESSAEPPAPNETKSNEVPTFCIDSYKESRMMAGNGLQNSAMLSTALSLGTLSIRSLYWAIADHITTLEHSNNTKDDTSRTTAFTWIDPTRFKSMNRSNSKNNIVSPVNTETDITTTPTSQGYRWLLMHLGIRDFFRYYSHIVLYQSDTTRMAMTSLSLSSSRSSPRAPLRPELGSDPLQNPDIIASSNSDDNTNTILLFNTWARGQTGFPYVDASMKELARTGWLSNRGRQNTASFLSKSLNIHWIWGMELFQALLIDCDEAINLGNWAYIAGVGADPRPDRVFKVVTQGEKYDPDGSYITTWLPLLKRTKVNSNDSNNDVIYIHRPWEEEEQSTYGRQFLPVVNVESQIAGALNKQR